MKRLCHGINESYLGVLLFFHYSVCVLCVPMSDCEFAASQHEPRALSSGLERGRLESQSTLNNGNKMELHCRIDENRRETGGKKMFACRQCFHCENYKIIIVSAEAERAKPFPALKAH